VTASAPVAVFGTHSCGSVPVGVAYCDHLEEQMTPIEALGTVHVAAVPFNQTGTPRHYIKIVGIVDGTTLTYDPVIAGAPATVNAGMAVAFEAVDHVRITSSQPILVAQMLEGSTAFDGTDLSGDPSLGIVPATNQYLAAYTFPTNPTWPSNYVSITKPAGATVTLDGTLVPAASFEPVGDGTYVVAHVLLANESLWGIESEPHVAIGSEPFGLIQYGYGVPSVSYLYAVALKLAP
jgi:hypothetical protein